MSIEFSVTVTGETIGRHLADNIEEAKYALTEFFERTDERDFKEFAEYANHDAQNLVAKLRQLADTIEQENIS